MSTKSGQDDPSPGGRAGLGESGPRLPLEEFTGPPLRDRADIAEYLFAARRYWKWLLLVVVIATGATYLISKFAMVRYYRTSAILQPTPFSKIDEFSDFSSSNSDFSWLTGQPGQAETTAYEYETIFESFAFEVNLAHRHHLTTASFTPPGINVSPTRPHSSWQIYRLLHGRFKADYSFRTGNLTISFVDTDPGRSAQMVGYFIGDLRDKLRQEEISHSEAAINSLRSEISATSDILLVQHLYGLLAKAVQREKLAQVQADFAFKVLDPPVPPDTAISPRVRLNCLLVAFLTTTLLGGLVFAQVYLRLILIRYRAASSDFTVPKETIVSRNGTAGLADISAQIEARENHDGT